jgi:hypothetical protein
MCVKIWGLIVTHRSVRLKRRKSCFCRYCSIHICREKIILNSITNLARAVILWSSLTVSLCPSRNYQVSEAKYLWFPEVQICDVFQFIWCLNNILNSSATCVFLKFQLIFTVCRNLSAHNVRLFDKIFLSRTGNIET